MKMKPGKIAWAVISVAFLFLLAGELPAAKTGSAPVWLEKLDLNAVYQVWGQVRAGKSFNDQPLTLQGKVYAHGLGMHAYAEMLVDLKRNGKRFRAIVGVDDETQSQGALRFEVWLDSRLLLRSEVLKGGGAPLVVDLDIRGGRYLMLIADNAADGGGHADWAEAAIELKSASGLKPQAVRLADGGIPTLAYGYPPAPAIHGPRRVGTTPGRPFHFLIPATGQGPLTYAAANLPPGLTLDPQTGIISGSLKADGEYTVNLSVQGPRGEARRRLTIVAGEHMLAQTPPLGWNSWNAWGVAVDEAKVRQATDAMVQSGLAAVGFQYINIDDGWEKGRDAGGRVLPNEKFPDMKRLADYVHSRGLKLGIYSSPGSKTCAGYEASWGHEGQDVRSYAEWGIDYLKYDWCSYDQIAPHPGLDELKRPYLLLRRVLDACGRDIVFSLCQYGMGEVWKWGTEVGGNLWRTTGDITDNWASLQAIGFRQDGLDPFAGPGHWNDPDMLVVGRVGWGEHTHPSGLTADEQQTHITLWSLLAAPLLIGCDLVQLDDFTRALLANDEVIDVNQDPLGKQGHRVLSDGRLEVWARPLADGTVAVGLFNRLPVSARVSAPLAALGLKGPQPVRDLWQKKSLGECATLFSAVVRPHGAVLVKIGKPQNLD